MPIRLILLPVKTSLPLDGAAHTLPSLEIKRGMSKRKELKLFRLGTKISKTFSVDGEVVRTKGQVLDCYALL